jgi:bifunctional dethiobiotin synthetase / adenosylmethionine---8-amino-7-oxononanoate aminotransferase
VDALRSLRLPAVLLGDCRLGGISATMAAYESLVSRGYDVAAVVGLPPHHAQHEEGSSASSDTYPGIPCLDNLDEIARHVLPGPCRPVPAVFSLPPAPAPPAADYDSTAHKVDPALAEWLRVSSGPAAELFEHLHAWHAKRRRRLEALAAVAERVVWWPFTQHAGVAAGDVAVIDARAGEAYLTLQGGPSNAPAAQTAAPAAAPTDGGARVADASDARDPRLEALYDGCASWWTQGVSAELVPLVQQNVAYAAGRYSHVIFPEAAHEPAVRLSELLLAGVGVGWAKRVFFSDDGSAPRVLCALAAGMQYYMLVANSGCNLVDYL